ncbi:peptidoglycan DD-metalloendopeptidase family protein [Ferrimonas gelatinilytica]
MVQLLQRLVLCLGSMALLPSCSLSQAPAPVAALHTGPTYHQRTAGSLTGSNYTVKKGDTLYSIAFASGVDYRTLAKWNRLDRRYTIYPGQRLLLRAPESTPQRPKSSAKVSSVAASSRSEAKPSAQSSEVRPQKQQKTTVDPNSQPRYAESASSQIANNQSSEKASQIALPATVSRWQWPTTGTLIRGFSSAEGGNKGLDIAAAEGTPVVSTAPGRVVYAGSALRGYGKLVIVKHSDDFLSAYAHNKRILVSEKQQVRAGQKIAEVGSTDAERSKLHFEIRYQGKSVDPMRYLPRR